MAVSGVSYVEGLDSGEQNYAHLCVSVSNEGATVIHTPAANKRIQIRWIYAISDPVSGVSPLIQVFLGAIEKYRVYALSKRQLVTGPVDGALSIALSEPGLVAVTVLFEEV